MKLNTTIIKYTRSNKTNLDSEFPSLETHDEHPKDAQLNVVLGEFIDASNALF